MSIYGSRSRAFTFAVLLDDIDMSIKWSFEQGPAHIKLSKEDSISTQASEDDDVSSQDNTTNIDVISPKCGIQCKTQVHSKYVVDNTTPSQHKQSHSQLVKHQFNTTASAPQLVAIHTNNTADTKQRFSLFVCFPQIHKQFTQPQTITVDSNHLKTLLNKRHKHRLLSALMLVTSSTIN